MNQWPTQRLKQADILPEASEPLGFSKDGHILAALNPESGVVFYNPQTKEPGLQIPIEEIRPGENPAAAISSDLQTLVVGLDAGCVRIWNTQTHESNVVKTLSDGPVELVALSPDGRTLITGGPRQPLRVRDLAGRVRTLPVRRVRRALVPRAWRDRGRRPQARCGYGISAKDPCLTN